MSPQDRFKSIVGFVTDSLRELGFRRRSQCFCRMLPELWHVVNLVRSRWNTAEECKFYVDFGVYVPGVFSMVHPDVKEPLCPNKMNLTISWSVGFQHPPFIHRSWVLKSIDPLPEADETVRQSVLYELRENILPFFDQFVRRTDVIRFLEWLRKHRGEIPGGVHIDPSDVWLPLDLAVLYWMEGDRASCSRELERASLLDVGYLVKGKIAALRQHLVERD